MCKPNMKCEICGDEFYKKPSRIKKENSHTCSMKCLGVLRHRNKVKEIEDKFNKPIRDLLYDLYIVNKYPTRKIGEIIGLSKSKVSEWIKKYDIEMRYGSEAIKTQWINNDIRRRNQAELAIKVLQDGKSRGKLRKIMSGEQFKENISKIKTKKLKCGTKKMYLYKRKKYPHLKGKEFTRVKSYREKQSISKRGSRNGMWGKRGELHPNWNPNRTHEQRVLERKTYEVSVWRKSVFERDKYICQCCGYDKGHILVAHHLCSYNEYEDLRTEVSNGITLCEDCHKDFHSKYGYGKNTREQFEEYLRTK